MIYLSLFEVPGISLLLSAVQSFVIEYEKMLCVQPCPDI